MILLLGVLGANKWDHNNCLWGKEKKKRNKKTNEKHAMILFISHWTLLITFNLLPVI